MSLIIAHIKHRSRTGLVYVIGDTWLKTIRGPIDQCLYAMCAEAEAHGFKTEVINHFER